MVFLALKLKTHLTLDAPNLSNPNILVLTDRIDLDDQISRTFVACGLPNPMQCNSVAALREAVNRGGNGQILLSTIFKFAGSKEPISNSANWIVLVDECHRTQEKDLGAYLQATLPDAHFYGFTGTPIKSTDKDTYARFSIAGEGYLDKYGIDDAVRDGAILIVCDKLLTGFDAPIEHVMYLDKPLKEHNLLQAIARTNRTYTFKGEDGGEIEKPAGRIVDYIGVTAHLDEALASYRSEDVENAMRDIAILRNDLKEAHARYRAQKRAMRLDGLDEKAAAYAAAKQAAEGNEDDWLDLQRLTRTFIKVYADLSPDPAILDFTGEVKWAAAFLRLATQAISKDESLDHRSYSGKIREMLEQHVHVTGLSTTIRLRSLTDPEFADDFATEQKSEDELQEAFVRKSAELRRVTRELVDKNPAQYGRFSERVLEIIRRFEEGQISAAEGLREYENLTGGIQTEQGAHTDLGMDEHAFSILRIMEAIVPDADHSALQSAAIAIGATYADAAATQPAFAHMEAFLRSLRQQVRRILGEHDIGETKIIREKVEEFAVHAYGSRV